MAWDSPCRFALTEDHVKLLRAAYVRWDEDGAPAIDAKRPYGNSDIEQDMARILGVQMAPEEELPDAERERLTELHRQTATALQVVLSTGSFEPGEYLTSKSYTNDWHRVHQVQVRAAFGQVPLGCPEPVWRMMVVAADLTLATGSTLEGHYIVTEDFALWAESAWLEADR